MHRYPAYDFETDSLDLGMILDCVTYHKAIRFVHPSGSSRVYRKSPDEIHRELGDGAEYTYKAFGPGGGYFETWYSSRRRLHRYATIIVRAWKGVDESSKRAIFVDDAQTLWRGSYKAPSSDDFDVSI